MAIGTLTLGSHVDCDFIHITSATPSQEDLENLNYEPSWDPDSRFLAAFNSTLTAGNVSDGGTPPEDWAIYRKPVNDTAMEFIGDVHGASVTIYDYGAPNSVPVQYISFPSTASRTASYSISGVVVPQWSGWTLITLDPTDEAGLYKPHQVFMFQLNLEVGDLSNNTTFNRMENFTRYPTIQRSSANYYAGQLRGLVGACDITGKYYDTLEMLEALRELTTDTRKKILKDYKGHVWEVELTSSMMFSTEQNLVQRMNSVTLQWAEVGDGKDIRAYVPELDYNPVINVIPPEAPTYIASAENVNAYSRSELLELVARMGV